MDIVAVWLGLCLFLVDIDIYAKESEFSLRPAFICEDGADFLALKARRFTGRIEILCKLMEARV